MVAKGSRRFPSCQFCKINEKTNATHHCTCVTSQINMSDTTLFAVSLLFFFCLFLFVTHLTVL
jgi:hypothetical protein